LVCDYPQKMMENFVLNSDDVAALTQFANQGDNLTKLGWNLSEPETWEGVQWFYANLEYHVYDISIDNLELTGNLNLSGMEQLVRVSCNNNSLTSIDVSDCARLFGLLCRNSGVSSLDISNCAALTVLDCEDNNLNISDIISDIDIIKLRTDAWVQYIYQKLQYDFTLTTPGLTYDDTSESFILSNVRFEADGVLPDSVFIEVNTFDASDDRTFIEFDTVTVDSSGVAVYSISSPVSIAAEGDEYAEISVYTDGSSVQLITRLIVRPVLFEY